MDRTVGPSLSFGGTSKLTSISAGLTYTLVSAVNNGPPSPLLSPTFAIKFVERAILTEVRWHLKDSLHLLEG